MCYASALVVFGRKQHDVDQYNEILDIYKVIDWNNKMIDSNPHKPAAVAGVSEIHSLKNYCFRTIVFLCITREKTIWKTARLVCCKKLGKSRLFRHGLLLYHRVTHLSLFAWLIRHFHDTKLERFFSSR
ncbi:hypothetical protein UB51_14000 [Paenibacillus sp. IHBB 10380]|nr:hypothetical protein UB51_14000 [Paenibacillus sp. IHBB 10380]